MTGVLLRRRKNTQSHRNIEGGRPCDNKGGDWSDASVSQERSRIASNYQLQGQGKEGFFQGWRKDGHANSFILNF